MAETARCTKCELEHERTPDWHCPRCGSEVDLVGGGRLRAADQFPAGSRVAGGVAVAAGALALAGQRGELSLGTLGALVSAALGVGLLARVRWVRVVAMVSTVLGVVLVSIAALLSIGRGGEHLVAALTCGGFLLLLRGTPGKLAIGGGVALCAPGLLLGAVYALQGRVLL